MTSICSLRCWELNIFLFLSVCPFLVAATTYFESGDAINIEDLLTGHVQIRKDSVPTEVLPCLTQPDLAATSDCQFKHSQWNSMHCLNNSFGMYANDNKFVNFGVEPLGIVFPSLFFNPISYPSYSECSSDSDEDTQKIETLLEANAEARMNITLLGEMIERLHREKEELEEQLDSVKRLNIEQRGQIHVFQLQAERWEEVHKECTASSVIHRNTTSIALRAAQDHIKHLELQNKILMDSNTKCSSDLRSLQEVLSNVQSRNEENEVKLARCSVSLTASRESGEAAEAALAKEEQEHIKHIEEYEKERTLLMSEINDAQTARASCEASLKDSRNVYEETKQYYEDCLGTLGGTKASLDLCRSALSLCHGNHSVASNVGQLCEEDRKLCLHEVAHLTESLNACKNDTHALHANVKTLKASEQKLIEQLMSIRSEMETSRLSKEQLNDVVNNLRADLQEERNALSDAEAHARECSLDLVTAKTSLDIAYNRAEEVSEKLDELRQRYTTLSRKNYLTVTDYSSLHESYVLLKNDNEKCHHMLDDASESAEALILNKVECYKQLTNVSTSLSIIESQRDACYSKHHSSIGEVDEWRVRYQDITVKLATCNMQRANCSGQLSMMTNIYNALEEEANEMQTLNVNLKERLNSTLESLSSITGSNTELREDLSAQKQIHADLSKQIAALEGIVEAEQSKHQDCLKKVRESDIRVTTLESRLSDLAGTVSFSQKRLDHCSQLLNDTQALLQEQHDVNSEHERTLLNVQSSLEVARSQYHGVLIQVESLERQLNLCRSNHTDTMTEVLNLEMQLLQCQKKVTEVQTASLRDIEQIEEQRMNCELSLRRTTEALNETLLSNELYQRELKVSRSEHSATKMSLSTCRSQLDVLIRRTSSVEALIHNLRKDKSTLQSRLKSATHEHGLTRGQLTLCREMKSKLELQLFDITEELEECHSSAQASSSWSSGCPHADQGMFASTKSGCLLVTHSTGSQHAMETLCGQQAGGRLLDRQTAIEPLFHTEVAELLAAGHLPRNHPVWLSVDGGQCYELDLNASDGPLVVQGRTCSDQLPGLCVAEHTHRISSSTYFFNTSSSSSHVTWGGSSGFDQSFFNQSFFNQSFFDSLDL